MQDLLGRIAALDPEASLGVRVIACFDELVLGRVGTRALLAAAASLAGCIAGCSWDDGRTLRIDPAGDEVAGEGDAPARRTLPLDGLGTVWIERAGAPLANDAIILERLALAVRMRRGSALGSEELKRPLGVLLDAQEPIGGRVDAAERLRLHDDCAYRVLVAPLFAVWTTHPHGPSDVISTRHGAVHVFIVDAQQESPTVSLLGVGTAAPISGLPQSFRAALTAMRLAVPGREPIVSAERLGGLVDLIADAESSDNVDASRIDMLMAHPWMPPTLDALSETTTLRQAARAAGVHHSTMKTRTDTIAAAIGYDPLENFGRTRLTVAYLVWRLRHSHALDLHREAPASPPSA